MILAASKKPRPDTSARKELVSLVKRAYLAFVRSTAKPVKR